VGFSIEMAKTLAVLSVFGDSKNKKIVLSVKRFVT
jgi:hypothetical protein